MSLAAQTSSPRPTTPTKAAPTGDMMPPTKAAPTTDLMSMLMKMSSDAQEARTSAVQKSESLVRSMERQRRKSRELEQEIFGMHITDVKQLQEIFDNIDEDHSGSIDATGKACASCSAQSSRKALPPLLANARVPVVPELTNALMKAGKTPSREQVKQLVTKYDEDGNGTIEFREYQTMIKNWEDDIAEFDSEKARLQAAVAAAEPAITPRQRRSRSRDDIGVGVSAGFRSEGASRRHSRDNIPTLSERITRNSSIASYASTPIKAERELTQADRDEIAARLGPTGARNRRASI